MGGSMGDKRDAFWAHSHKPARDNSCSVGLNGSRLDSIAVHVDHVKLSGTHEKQLETKKSSNKNERKMGGLILLKVVKTLTSSSSSIVASFKNKMNFAQ